VSTERLASNPALAVEGVPKASRPQIKPWSPSEPAAFLRAAERERLAPFFELMAATVCVAEAGASTRPATTPGPRGALEGGATVGEASNQSIGGETEPPDVVGEHLRGRATTVRPHRGSETTLAALPEGERPGQWWWWCAVRDLNPEPAD
jgi:hypothetical protein